MSLLWISQTGAGSRYGFWGTGAGVLVGGTIGPSFVFQWTRMPRHTGDRAAKNRTKLGI